MKRQALLLLPLLLTILFSFKLTENKDIEVLTSGKWYVEYFSVEGEKLEFAPEVQQRNWMLFKQDGKAEFMIESRKGIGNWEYDPESRIIKTIHQQEIKEHRLISVTKEQLILQELDEDQATIGLRK